MPAQSILVVEDEPSSAEVVGVYLQRAGHAVRTAARFARRVSSGTARRSRLFSRDKDFVNGSPCVTDVVPDARL